MCHFKNLKAIGKQRFSYIILFCIDDAMKGIYKPEENEGKKKKSFKEKVEEKLKETFED